MKNFLRFFNWGLEVKLYMGIYTIALLFAKGVVVLLDGGDSIGVWTILQMTFTAFAVGFMQHACFPPNQDLDKAALKKRTIVWGLCFNALFIGASAAFGWFAGIPAWGALLLVVILEWSLVAMWVGIHVAKKMDTDALNGGLKRYQGGNS